YFRYAAISAVETAGSFTAKYFFEDSDPLYPHLNKAENISVINNREYWAVDKNSGQADVILTLSWDENSTTPSDLINAEFGELHIVRWNAQENMWVDEGG